MFAVGFQLLGLVHGHLDTMVCHAYTKQADAQCGYLSAQSVSTSQAERLGQSIRRVETRRACTCKQDAGAEHRMR